MNRFLFLILTTILFGLTVCAQNGASSSVQSVLLTDSGEVKNGVYENRFFEFTYPLSDGYYNVTDSLKSTSPHLPDRTYMLLAADKHTGRRARNRVMLVADDCIHYRPSMSLSDYADKVARTLARVPGNAVMGEPFSFDLTGEHYIRFNYSESSEGITLFKSTVFAKLRGYWLMWTFVSTSDEELESDVNSLARITYGKYRTEPIGSRSNIKPSNKRPSRIRVSQAFAENLLLKKTVPEYPQEALQRRIQGDVVLRVLINRDGVIREATYVSGDLVLKSAAMNAVTQWQYRPYEVNGTPVEVDTQVTVAFRLPPHK